MEAKCVEVEGDWGAKNIDSIWMTQTTLNEQHNMHAHHTMFLFFFFFSLSPAFPSLHVFNFHHIG